MAAIRELDEECRVLAEPTEVLKSTIAEYDDRIVELVPVVCRWIEGDGVPLASTACEWRTLDEIQGMEMPPANAAIIETLRHHLAASR